MSPRRPLRKAELRPEARRDLIHLNEDDPRLAKLGLETVRRLERGEIEGEPLAAMATAGDLADCRKLYFGVGSPPSHRVVYVDRGPKRGIEIVEVVALEAREALYVYLLAAQRLGRLPSESQRRFDRLHQEVVQRRAKSRKR